MSKATFSCCWLPVTGLAPRDSYIPGLAMSLGIAFILFFSFLFPFLGEGAGKGLQLVN